MTQTRLLDTQSRGGAGRGGAGRGGAGRGGAGRGGAGRGGGGAGRGGAGRGGAGRGGAGRGGAGPTAPVVWWFHIRTNLVSCMLAHIPIVFRVTFDPPFLLSNLVSL